MASKFVCRECGKQSAVPLKLCPSCGEFDTFDEVVAEKKSAKSKNKVNISVTSTPIALSDITEQVTDRWSSGSDEFDRVLGGGIVPGSIITLAGEPGSGKSTLMLSTADYLSKNVGRVLYVSSEESEPQIKIRASRMGINSDNIYIIFENDIDAVIQVHVAKIKPMIIIIDSITAMMTQSIESSVNSPSQIKYSIAAVQQLTKTSGISCFTIGQVTKEGNVTGPRVLDHTVDALLYLEGDEWNLFRFLRAQKNRFGGTGEVGVFEMKNNGLIGVENASAAFLRERAVDAPGSTVSVLMEGTRPFLLEIQVLCSSAAGNPARRSVGINKDTLHKIAAIVDRNLADTDLFDTDILANVVGGLKAFEPAVDLPIALSVYSSYHGIPIPPDYIGIAELGLTGELHSVPQLESRIREAALLGFTHVITAPIKGNIKIPSNIQVVECTDIKQVAQFVFGTTYEENIAPLGVKKHRADRYAQNDEYEEEEYSVPSFSFK